MSVIHSGKRGLPQNKDTARTIIISARTFHSNGGETKNSSLGGKTGRRGEKGEGLRTSASGEALASKGLLLRRPDKTKESSTTVGWGRHGPPACQEEKAPR